MDWLAAYGPVSVLVDAMTQIWWPYTGGVVSACCDVSTDHAVLLVGYGESAEEGKYWVIKNSVRGAVRGRTYLRRRPLPTPCPHTPPFFSLTRLHASMRSGRNPGARMATFGCPGAPMSAALAPFQ